ncbi:hypothetical protein [Actinokineospora iranica]|uniref:Uncharacterized protein n=1 Tax=Actinokineospora iranica TaxID=1271860 RepID=A0A1G6P1P2_9PSEU|nr:hypothetical protein [Actinokineospora iranica]SDC74200.1 hypothetical protein SAMN05216174_10480 [Actinokineospora iranica]
MRAYVDGHPVETTPRFRATGRGRAVTSASFSVPLRHDDLTAILYTSTLTTDQLTDADHVRTVIADTLVNKGANRIAQDKAAFLIAVNNRTHDPARLTACTRRITTLFPRATTARAATRDHRR